MYFAFVMLSWSAWRIMFVNIVLAVCMLLGSDVSEKADSPW